MKFRLRADLHGQRFLGCPCLTDEPQILSPGDSRLDAARRARRVARAFGGAWLVAASPLHAQGIEPRAYSNAPVGVNFLIAGYAYTRGDLEFATLPLSNANLNTSNAVVAYARAVDFFGKSGKVDVIAPHVWLSGTANYLGQPIERTVDGFADPAFRVTINFYGAPAMSLAEFAGYKQD